MDFSMMDFNYFDVTIASIILILGIKGFMQGFIKEAFVTHFLWSHGHMCR